MRDTMFVGRNFDESEISTSINQPMIEVCAL